jgi:Flp pilus assembly protein TadD
MSRSFSSPAHDIQARLEGGVRLHRSGDLDGALLAYQGVLSLDPRHPTALGLVGALAHQRGAHDVAERVLRRALQYAPGEPDHHSNLGSALVKLNRPLEAARAFKVALELEPRHPHALGNLVTMWMDAGQPEFAMQTCDQAQLRGRDDAQVWRLRGWALQEMDALDDAVLAYREAWRRAPEDVQILVERGTLCWRRGEPDAAEELLKHAVELDPTGETAVARLAILLLESGRVEHAAAVFAFGLVARRGPPGRGGPPLCGPFVHTDMGSVGLAKLDFDMEQVRFLARQGTEIGTSAGCILGLRAARRFVADHPRGAEAMVQLPPELLARIGAHHGRIAHMEPADQIVEGALRPMDSVAISASYGARTHGLVVLDNLLSPVALAGLRHQLLHSTAWFDGRYTRGYIGSKLGDGLASPLVLQIAHELREALPEVLGPHPLRQAWAYGYPSSQGRGVGVHVDSAAVNINLWLTPDEANLEPDRGGLVVFREPAPPAWAFKDADRNPGRLRSWLDTYGDDFDRIPHRQNRAVLFHADRFHESDRLRFREGFEDRRISLTFLYGEREA